jgi:hypothetical protein
VFVADDTADKEGVYGGSEDDSDLDLAPPPAGNTERDGQAMTPEELKEARGQFLNKVKAI